MDTQSDPSGATINADFLADIRVLVRKYQRHLIDNPDPRDPWWFLVDPDAPQ